MPDPIDTSTDDPLPADEDAQVAERVDDSGEAEDDSGLDPSDTADDEDLGE